MTRLTQLFAAAAVVLALAILLPMAGSVAEARNSPTFTQEVEVRFEIREGDITTHAWVRATRQRGSPDEVRVDHSVWWCVDKGLFSGLCGIHLHPTGWYDASLNLDGLHQASLTVVPNPEIPCFAPCPVPLGVRHPTTINLNWEGIGGVNVEGNTKTRDAIVTTGGIVEGVKVPPGVYGTISVTQSRPPQNN